MRPILFSRNGGIQPRSATSSIRDGCLPKELAGRSGFIDKYGKQIIFTVGNSKGNGGVEMRKSKVSGSKSRGAYAIVR